MQQLPLMDQGAHARLGVPSEEQAAQSTAWHAVIVYASMLSSLSYLCDLHIELANGKHWFSLSDAPLAPNASQKNAGL